MREILFRGKSIKRGEWIYGYLNQHRGNIRYDCDCEPIADGCYYINDWQTKIDTGMYGQNYKVDPSTIGQFTGLTDKNGVKIFEGDIIEFDHPYNGKSIHAVVQDGCGWNLSNFYASCFDYPGCAFSEGTKYMTVIGNVHDNPELLEVSGDEA